MITEAIQSTLSFDRAMSSHFGVDTDRNFTGNVTSALGISQKADIVRQQLINTSQSVAFGDSKGDVGILALVDSAVCVQPSDELRFTAHLNNWRVIENAHSHLLYIFDE